MQNGIKLTSTQVANALDRLDWLAHQIQTGYFNAEACRDEYQRISERIAFTIGSSDTQPLSPVSGSPGDRQAGREAVSKALALRLAAELIHYATHGYPSSW